MTRPSATPRNPSAGAAAAAALAGLLFFTPALAQTGGDAPPLRPSPCLAFAEAPAGPSPWRITRAEAPIRAASFVEALGEREMGLTFIGHATFLLETPEGVTLATDFAGFAGAGVVPRAVTMNGAHSTHFTPNPDPRIETVLRGWRDDGAPAGHDLAIDDLRIRSVSTDTGGWTGGLRPNGNSIFVFELGDLCVGHLGHLHHVPTPEQFAQIGFLDVVMAPVDGGYTLPIEEMVETLEGLRARVVIPMHAFGATSLQRFLGRISDVFPVERHDSATLIVSKRSLPRETTVIVLPELSPRNFYDMGN